MELNRIVGELGLYDIPIKVHAKGEKKWFLSLFHPEDLFHCKEKFYYNGDTLIRTKNFLTLPGKGLNRTSVHNSRNQDLVYRFPLKKYGRKDGKKVQYYDPETNQLAIEVQFKRGNPQKGTKGKWVEKRFKTYKRRFQDLSRKELTDTFNMK